MVLTLYKLYDMSLPSRGAWIEILAGPECALPITSLPSRGAWIEIHLQADGLGGDKVAPLTGSVDRNSLQLIVSPGSTCRSPHGERG